MSIGRWAAGNGVSYSTAYQAYHGYTHTQAAEAAHEIEDRRSGELFNPIKNRRAAEPVKSVFIGKRRFAAVTNEIAAAFADVPF
jgi:hypothetical protein